MAVVPNFAHTTLTLALPPPPSLLAKPGSTSVILVCSSVVPRSNLNIHEKSGRAWYTNHVSDITENAAVAKLV